MKQHDNKPSVIFSVNICGVLRDDSPMLYALDILRLIRHKRHGGGVVNVLAFNGKY